MAQDRGDTATAGGSLPWTEAAYCGYIDAVESGRIYGWAWNPLDPAQELAIDIFHHDRCIAEVVANRFRSDLLDLGIGDGRHAFVVDLPPDLRGAGPLDFSACFHGTTIPLVRGPRAAPPPEVTDSTESELAGLRHRLGQLEENLATAINMLAILRQEVGGGARRSQESTQEQIKALRADLDVTRKALTDTEVFLLRFDERLKTRIDREELEAWRRRRPHRADWLFVVGFVLAVIGGLGTIGHLFTLVARYL